MTNNDIIIIISHTRVNDSIILLVAFGQRFMCISMRTIILIIFLNIFLYREHDDSYQLLECGLNDLSLPHVAIVKRNLLTGDRGENMDC